MSIVPVVSQRAYVDDIMVRSVWGIHGDRVDRRLRAFQGAKVNCAPVI